MTRHAEIKILWKTDDSAEEIRTFGNKKTGAQ
jgi:hypothetical protein